MQDRAGNWGRKEEGRGGKGERKDRVPAQASHERYVAKKNCTAKGARRPDLKPTAP